MLFLSLIFAFITIFLCRWWERGALRSSGAPTPSIRKSSLLCLRRCLQNPSRQRPPAYQARPVRRQAREAAMRSEAWKGTKWRAVKIQRGVKWTLVMARARLTWGDRPKKFWISCLAEVPLKWEYAKYSVTVRTLAKLSECEISPSVCVFSAAADAFHLLVRCTWYIEIFFLSLKRIIEVREKYTMIQDINK